VHIPVLPPIVINAVFTLLFLPEFIASRIPVRLSEQARKQSGSRLFETALYANPFDHVGRFIVNANHKNHVIGCDASRTRLHC
jgi:hypothetical protein